jgi:hypothetical protein
MIHWYGTPTGHEIYLAHNFLDLGSKVHGVAELEKLAQHPVFTCPVYLRQIYDYA